MPNQTEAKRALCFVPGQSGGRVQHHAQVIALRQFAIFGGDAAGDLLKLLAAGKIMLHYHQELL